MPCYDPGSERTMSHEEEADCKEAARILCELCENDYYASTDLSTRIAKWYDNHARIDAKKKGESK
jgi:hypothetical protein